MSDDLNNSGPADRQRISLKEEWEVRYWTNHLGISEAQLQKAVGEVGHMAADVRKWLDGR